MTNASPFRDLGLSCPKGGKFYICEGCKTEFVGCCTSNPCTDGSGTCPDGDLMTATFSADAYNDIPAQSCADTDGDWYTCMANVPPFLGCCSSNPCQNATLSCPSPHLVPAKLSTVKADRAPFLTSGSTSKSTGLSTGAVAGIVAGIAVLLVIIVGVVMYKLGWRARIKRERAEASNAAMAQTEQPAYPDGNTPQSGSSPYPDSYTASSTTVAGSYAHSPYIKQGSQHSPTFNRYSSSTEGAAGSPHYHGYHAGHHYTYSGDSNHALLQPVPELQGNYLAPELSGDPKSPIQRAYGVSQDSPTVQHGVSASSADFPIEPNPRHNVGDQERDLRDAARDGESTALNGNNDEGTDRIWQGHGSGIAK
ncbi:hypothetical protein NKR23_g3746 [Pleurostoma richardsiae]|uniref:Uncharacterized protein n=1 Tax=Pleurostoma richardsiae TaxID=41990 RepID=A0AA38RTU3_9PEZI|nr:hypothetical protein NKR23_g3746 [Pleurostoma richardsiae]